MFKLLVLLLVTVYCQNPNRYSHKCAINFYWTGQTCMPCQTGCQCYGFMECNNPISCDVGYTLNQINTQYQCLQCPSGCSSCYVQGQNGFICQQCQSDYLLINGLCFPLSYNFSEVSGAFFGSGLWDVPKWDFPSQIPEGAIEAYTILPCLNRDLTNSLCISCPIGSFLNEIAICEGCPLNCKKCSSRGTCQICQSGYYWSVTNLQIQPKFNGAGQCKACEGLGVATCELTGVTPLTCFSGYYLTSLNNQNTCQTCSIYCSTCSSLSSCQQCQTGTYLATNGNCYMCSGNSEGNIGCQNCQTSGYKTCDSCSDGYLLVGSVCVNCQANEGCYSCSTYNNTLYCTSCLNGYYLSQGKCYSCNSVNPNYYLCTNFDESSDESDIQVTQCITDESTQYSSLASSNYLLVNKFRKYQCQQNMGYCLSMTYDSDTCQTCATGWVLIGTQCQQCSTLSNCQECVGIGLAISCIKCDKSSYLNSGICTVCSEGCTKCESSTQCSKCAVGYLISANQCQLCQIANCSTCLTTSTCDICLNQFYLYTPIDTSQSQQCLLCPPGCANCQISNGMKCTLCLDGFYQQGDGCTPGAQYCAVYDDNGKCNQCEYGAFVSNYDGNCYMNITIGAAYVYQGDAGSTQCAYNNILFLQWLIIILIMIQ